MKIYSKNNLKQEVQLFYFKFLLGKKLNADL